MNDVDCKTGAACGVGPWFTRLAAHNTPYVVHWVLAGSASSRPQLYTASVRIHTPYTFWMMPEWRKAKVQTKGKTRSNTYTHAQEELCVNPQGTECYIHTHRERKHWEQHGTQTTPLIFCLFEAQKMEGIIGRGVIVESSHWDISSFFVERAKTTTTKKKASANKFITVIVRAPHVLHRTRLSNDIGWKVTLHVKIKFGLIVFLSLSVCGGLHQKQPTFCVSILIWFIYLFIESFRHGWSLGSCSTSGLFSTVGLCQFEIGR